jgi:hypothetical protein
MTTLLERPITRQDAQVVSGRLAHEREWRYA